MSDSVDTKVVGKAFRVEVNGQFVPVRSYSGGNPVAERRRRSSAGSKHNEGTVGHHMISDLILQAYVTPTQKIFADAAHRVANLGQNARFTITITELAKDKSVVKTFVYDNCLLTSLDFPRLNAQSGDLLCETATFKPEILDVS